MAEKSPNKTILVGTPKSTFTRTIALALHELGLPFDQIDCLPKSDEAYHKGVNPFGHIPSIHIDGASLFESIAIANYLDAHHTHPASLTLRPTTSNPIHIDQLVSIASDYVFRTLEFTCVKPRHALESAGSTEEEITKQLENGVLQSDSVLNIVEKLANEHGPYLTGPEITWADLYVYPILADYKSIPEGRSVRGGLPRLSKWIEQMENRESVKKTFPGTIADLRNSLNNG